MRKLIIVFLLTLTTIGCSKETTNNTGSSSSWAYEKMVTFNGSVYVVSNEQVLKVDKKIGEVKYFSTDEKDSKNDQFSNYYHVGTSLYSIPNIDLTDSIAVEDQKDNYFKAINERKLSK